MEIYVVEWTARPGGQRQTDRINGREATDRFCVLARELGAVIVGIYRVGE